MEFGSLLRASRCQNGVMRFENTGVAGFIGIAATGKSFIMLSGEDTCH